MHSKGRAAKRSNLAFSLASVVLLIFVVGQGVMWTGFLFFQKSEYHGMLRGLVEETASLTSQFAYHSIREDEMASLKHFIDNVVDSEDILSVKVTDAGGAVLVQSASNVEERTASSNPFYVPWKATVVEPVMHEGKKQGNVEITYSGRRVNAAMLRLLILPSVAQVLVFLFMLWAIYSFVQTRVGRPIAKLRRAIGQMADGDLSVEIPEMQDSELGRITEGLEVLSKRFRSTVVRLNMIASGVAETMARLEEIFRGSSRRLKEQARSTDQIASSLRHADETQGRISQNTELLTGITSENLSSLLEFKASEEEMSMNVATLHEATDNSFSTVVEMSQMSRSMQDSVQRVLGAVENTSASVEEIIASVRDVESSARESSRLAESVRTEAAQQGMVTVDRAIREMQAITERVTYSVEIVTRLGTRSDDVQRILSVIREVTEQTNMLSVNASILAEQAGEFGKGFYVVANQMRALSERTSGYTKEIGGIVSTIRNEIGEAVESIKKGMTMVNSGSEAVYLVGESVSSILESAHQSAHMTKMIERSTQDQVAALNHIESAIIDVNTTALEMSRGMDEMTRSAGYIRDRVGEVKDVADVTRGATAAMRRGTAAVYANIEGSGKQVRSIADSVRQQQNLSKAILSEIESIRSSGSLVKGDMESVSESLAVLKRDFEALRIEMNAFKTG
jgi:methyl-accepting chemotaxis protein